MYKIHKLKNGLNLITIDMPHLNSVTSLIAVATGSRYETKQNNGISHFLEHMFFKGSKKYPSAEQIANIVDSIGAINNAATSKEYTYYWIKSSAKHLELSIDILSSMLKESLLDAEEIEREKGVIIEERRMKQDNPMNHIWDLYEQLQFGDQPLGWDVLGPSETIKSLNRDDFVKYVSSLYSPKNMAVVFAGKIPDNIQELTEKYFLDMPSNSHHEFLPVKKQAQAKPRIHIHHKDTDQANLILGLKAYDRHDDKRFAARLMGVILGEGMSSRLFMQVRERRGLAYHVFAGHDPYIDTGTFVNYAGLKLEKTEEGLKVIKDELEKLTREKVTDDELKKSKEMERGRIALRSESTNFLAEHFGTEFVLDDEIETFEDYLKKIDEVSVEDILAVAKELIDPTQYNLQLIGPFKDTSPFEKILNS